MSITKPYLRHWFLVLVRQNVLGLCLVLASATSLIVQGIATKVFNWWYLVPLAFLLTYLWVHLRAIARLARQTYRAVPLPYSVCLAQSHDWYEAAIRQQEQTLESAKIAWLDIQRTYHVHRIDWAYFDENRLDLAAATWKAKITDIVRHFEHLTNRIPIQPVYHFFLALPAPISFALGARIGRRVPMVVYQHAGIVKDPYAAVFNSEQISQDDGYHLLNKRIDEYKLIKFESITGEQKNGSVLIILDFTGHELPKPYPGTESQEVVYVQLAGSKGHIPLRSNWIELAHELASLIFSFVDNDRPVCCCPGIPSSLAFIVGTIVGTIPGVTLYHFNRHDDLYTEGIVLNEL